MYAAVFFANERSVKCLSPHEVGAPHEVDVAFGVDSKVFSGMKIGGLKDQPISETITTSWGLSWGNHLWATFEYNPGDGVTVATANPDNKGMTTLMNLILWYGALLIVLVTVLAMWKVFSDAMIQFKLDMLVRDPVVRPVVMNLVTCLNVDLDGSGSVSEQEVSDVGDRTTKV